MELNKKQIERQELVDNSIFNLLLSLNPTEKHFDWDIEMSAVIKILFLLAITGGIVY